jgi:ribonuclease P protein component
MTSTVEKYGCLAELPHSQFVSRVALDLGPWMPPKKTARFPRTARLLRHADFERVYKQGRRHFSASMTVFYLPRLEEQMPKAGVATRCGAAPKRELRVGFTVGRVLGGAVQRNRMKRRLREAVRLCRPAVDVPVDIVINPKKSLLITEFAVVVNEVRRAFVVIGEQLRPGRAQSGKTQTAPREGVSRSPKPEA